ncbi:metallophosphoesterase [Thermofilum pendens]|uniref:Phosphoesterase n=1 Tax=Thermofilum pendens (strain DSM 2475 / Hrk 5) TaxID=368408 RepID=A1RYP7_THEPD|nr:metallophosphoesterase [Thermofilum pendens]ABL78327.1 putative phosphoesterase [Thermofilum pendens Hrk 5]
MARTSVLEVPRLRLRRGLEVVGYGLYVEELGSLLVADLHVGYEGALAEQGVFVPPLQAREMKEALAAMIGESGAERVIILGDVKHEFGDVTRQEWRETIDLLEYLKRGLGVRVDVVRGNHDNYLVVVLKRLEIPFHDPYLLEGDWLFIHGHKPFPVEGFREDVRFVAMGHEHPALALRDSLGVKVKLKALLEGSYTGKQVYVLPALSPLMPGTEVNVERSFLSPLLRETGVDEYKAYGVDLEAGIFDFGEVKYLRNVSEQ